MDTASVPLIEVQDMVHTPDLPRALSVRQACERLGISRSGLAELRRLEDFPLPIALGGQRIAFLREELDVWLSSRERVRVAQRQGLHRPLAGMGERGRS